MQIMVESQNRLFGPKQRAKHVSYNENVDEPAKLIDQEAVEIEREVPAEDSDPVERSDDGKSSEPPIFEE